MENSAVYSRIEDLEVDVKNVVSSVNDISDEVYDLWFQEIGCKPGEDAIYATTTFARSASTDGTTNKANKPTTTTKVCEITGSGVLYSAIVRKYDVYGNTYIKLTIDGHVSELRSQYNEGSKAVYSGYYATKSSTGNVIPTSGFSVSSTELLGSTSAKNTSDFFSGTLDVVGNVSTTLPITFKESLKVEVAVVDSSANTNKTNSASVCYSLNE